MNAGALRLCRLLLRRDWLRLVLWLVILGVFAVTVPLVFEGMFSGEAEREAMALTMTNPAMTALFGIGYGISNYTTGAMMAHEMLLITMIAVAIANILLVVRHTRKAEELGRLEMVLSLPVGRMANLTATLVCMLVFDVAIAAEHVVIFGLLGIESMPFLGNLYYGLCLGVAGFAFAAATALIVQAAASSRSATGIAMAFFALCYMLRAVGDLGNEPLSVVSLLGLPVRAKPYVDETPWPLVITLLVALALCVPAYLLQGRRDMDAGLLPQRAGRRRAKRWMRSPLGLAWRLNRGMVAAWAVGLFVFGTMYGSVFGDMEGFLDSSDFLKAIMSNMDFTLTEQFLAMLMSVLALAAVIPAVALALRLRAEEKGNKTEHLAARSVSRARMMTAYVVLSMAACAVMMFMTSLGLWASAFATMAEPVPFGQIMAAGMAYVPAMMVLCGLAFALTGLLPRATAAVWVLLVYGFLAGYIARLMQLDEWVGYLSPFNFVPQMPVEEFSVLPIAVLVLLAVLLTAAGYVGYRRRDLQG